MKISTFSIFIYFILFYRYSGQCTNFDEDYKCAENQHEYPESWDERSFQTPPRNDIFGRYKPSYQDMHYLVGYAQLKYSQDQKSCNVIFKTRVNPKLGIENQDYKIIYKFGDIKQNDNTFLVTSDDSYPEGLPISAEIVDMDNNHLVQLVLENEFFIWDHPKIDKPENIYENGQKGVIVELLGWPYDDIAEECEFLGYAGYLGVKIYSPNEHLLTYRSTYKGELNFLDFIFNPVSYKLKSRMGDKFQLKNMINKCRKNGIRVYAELVINHMTANGDDMYEKHVNNDCSVWGSKDGSAGSPFWTTKGLNKNNIYTKLPPVIEYPAVPYFTSDFHCDSYIEYEETDKEKMNYGWLYNLCDLNTQKEYVQQRIADFFTELISIGISGFTFNSAVNVPPSDYISILKKLKSNLGKEELPEDFIIYLQVDIWNDRLKEIYICNNDSNYGFTKFITEKMKEEGFNDNDILKIKLWNTGYMSNKFPTCNNEWPIPQERYILALNNHYVQSIEAGDDYIVKHNIDKHKKIYIKLLTDESINVKIKIIYSSYSLMNNGGFSFPDGKSDCNKCINEECKNSCTKSVPYQKAYNPLSIGYDPGNGTDWKEGTYTRVHRNIEIVNSMRSWMKLNLFENEDELFKYERLKANCTKGCLICDEESKKLGLCLYCNIDEEYYPIFNENVYERYHKCLHISNKGKYYLDEENKNFKPCYNSCKTCDKEGNETIHNCLTCENEYIFLEDALSSYKNNCILKIECELGYPHYYGENGEYKCSKTTLCPKEANLFIKEKNECVNDCKKDDIYKYQYSGNCLENCPSNTYNLTFLCKEIDMGKCSLSEIEINMEIFYEDEGISSIVKGYSKEFLYQNNHVSKFKNENYDIIFYKNPDCIDELSLDMAKVNFKDCYEKVQKYYSIKENLVIVTHIKYLENSHITTHSFYNPMNGQKLDAETICKNMTIEVEEKIITRFQENNIDYELLLHFTKQNINIFNISDEFYTDICYPFDSPINKDITLKDRLLTFYPNITLCEKNCENIGINLTDMTANCKCKFNDIINNQLFKDNVLINSFTNEILEYISQSNIEVVKCYKYILKYFKKSFGGYITIFFIFIQIILTIFYYRIDLFNIKNYIFKLTSQYLSYLPQNNNNLKDERKSYSRKSTIKKYKERKSHIFAKDSKTNLNNDNSSNIDLNRMKSCKYISGINNKLIIRKSKKLKTNEIKRNTMKESTRKTKKKDLNTNNYISLENIKNKNKGMGTDFEKYIKIPLDNLPYDDAIKKDKRKFCFYLCYSIKNRQIIANIFFEKDHINTRTIKLMMFDLDIILYFVINALFYNEDYVSEVYHLKGKENFFSFFSRSIYRFLYATLVNIILNIIVEFFMINENKLKGIFRREKENENILKSEVLFLAKKISKNNLLFIIILFILYFLFLFYILCFNYVYPNMQIEWIKSSIAIIIIMQLLSIFSIIAESILRYMSFFFKSEKLYKASKLLNK